MFTLAHASSYEQCSWWKDEKGSKRRSCIRDNLSSDQNQAKSPRSMGLKLQTHNLLSPAQWPRQIWFNFILLYPTTFDAYGEVTFWWIKPNKSHVTPWTNPKTHQTFIIDEPRWRTSWISTLWWRTQQHFDGQNAHPDFQVKACGAQDTWHNTIGHLTTAIWAQKLYK